MSLSNDRLRIASDVGLVGLAFGLLFSTSGTFCVYVMVLNFFQQPFPEFLQLAGGTAAMLLVGGGHFACGTLLLWRDRVTVDRRLRFIHTIKGWLGTSRHRVALLPPLTTIITMGSPRFMDMINGRQMFCVSLISNGDHAIRVGFATTEHLATQIEGELREFLGITPQHE